MRPRWMHSACPDVGLLSAGDVGRPGVTRRQVLAGAGAAGAASVGAQLLNTRVAFGASPGSGTLVVVFLRGGMDGLSVLVPAEDPHLLEARPQIAVRERSLLPLARGFGFHAEMAPLEPLWRRGQLAAVPAVATPDLSRSHFQAQDCLERGGPGSGTREGWLDRVLERLGPGTAFQGVGQGPTLPRALIGTQPSLSLNTVEAFRLPGGDRTHMRTARALGAMYDGWDHPLAADVEATLEALAIAEDLPGDSYQPETTYPDDDLGKGLAEVAQLVKGDVGLRVACIDVEGWDMHTNLGTADQGQMQASLSSLAGGLSAFAEDLGEKFEDVTVVTMTEFGRRVEENANAGTDHGHGGVVLLLGGGVAGGTVHGNWEGLAPEVLDQGDVPGLNDYRDLLGEVIGAQFDLGADDLSAVFPGHDVRPIGVMR